LCDDGENGDTCPQDCSHVLGMPCQAGAVGIIIIPRRRYNAIIMHYMPSAAVCGNGICERYGSGDWQKKYEDEWSCPLDCPRENVCHPMMGTVSWAAVAVNLDGDGVRGAIVDCCRRPAQITCGNGRCDVTESCFTCEDDCGKACVAS
jgi:hypothetical protein